MNISIEWFSLIATIVLAFLGYVVTYFNNLSMSRRAERLQLITFQINELYGSMYIITQTGDALFTALHAKAQSQGRTFVNQDAPKSADGISEWRIWLETVFIPMNERLAEIIVQKSHLIRELEMPASLRLFMMHHAGYKALIRKWECGDFSESTSIIAFPTEISDYARRSYQELKQEQLRIIALTSRSRRLKGSKVLAMEPGSTTYFDGA